MTLGLSTKERSLHEKLNKMRGGTYHAIAVACRLCCCLRVLSTGQCPKRVNKKASIDDHKGEKKNQGTYVLSSRRCLRSEKGENDRQEDELEFTAQHVLKMNKQRGEWGSL